MSTNTMDVFKNGVSFKSSFRHKTGVVDLEGYYQQFLGIVQYYSDTLPK
ncbi:hypothetical protein [Desulfosporosinus sp. OT]|nr:hypothetical protein [Desulfosporosinus sp. OT]